MSAHSFDPNQKVEGFTFTLGEVEHGGDCFWGMPAVFIVSKEKLPEGSDHYPETEEQYAKYGVRLPDEIEVLRDIQIGCENYQAIVKLGIAVQTCVSCPLLNDNK